MTSPNPIDVPNPLDILKKLAEDSAEKANPAATATIVEVTTPVVEVVAPASAEPTYKPTEANTTLSQSLLSEGDFCRVSSKGGKFRMKIKPGMVGMSKEQFEDFEKIADLGHLCLLRDKNECLKPMSQMVSKAGATLKAGSMPFMDFRGVGLVPYNMQDKTYKGLDECLKLHSEAREQFVEAYPVNKALGKASVMNYLNKYLSFEQLSGMESIVDRAYPAQADLYKKFQLRWKPIKILVDDQDIKDWCSETVETYREAFAKAVAEFTDMLTSGKKFTAKTVNALNNKVTALTEVTKFLNDPKLNQGAGKIKSLLAAYDPKGMKNPANQQTIINNLSLITDNLTDTLEEDKEAITSAFAQGKRKLITL